MHFPPFLETHRARSMHLTSSVDTRKLIALCWKIGHRAT